MHNAILIISHKRPECSTAKAILKAGYKGEWYIVVDDMDDTNYEDLYPGKIIRFCKQDYIDTVDTADNFRREAAATYAREACFDIAKELDIDCFGLFDDDLKEFTYRCLEGKKLRSKKVKNFTRIFDAYCKYVSESDFACGAFVSAGRLIGGAENPLIKKGGFYYNPTNAYIINARKEQFHFIGSQWEDSNYCYLNNMTGRIAAAFMPIVITMVAQGAMASGGCTELYEMSGSFIAESYSNMVIPSFFRWNEGCIGHKFSQNVPRIINEKWRKADAE